MNIIKKRINDGRGFWEAKNFLTGKAPIHQAVAEKKEFQKEFGKTPLSIIQMEKGMVSLHFDKINERDYGTFCESSLKFASDNNIKINITNEAASVVVRLPKQQALAFHDCILAKFGDRIGCDFEDLMGLIDFKELETGKVGL